MTDKVSTTGDRISSFTSSTFEISAFLSITFAFEWQGRVGGLDEGRYLLKHCETAASISVCT